jgi:hypothetical protein
MLEQAAGQAAIETAIKTLAGFADATRAGILQGMTLKAAMRNGLAKIFPKITKFYIIATQSEEIVARLSQLGITAVDTLIKKATAAAGGDSAKGAKAALAMLQQLAESSGNTDIAAVVRAAFINAGESALTDAAATGILSSTVSSINTALMGITIINGVFSFMNIGKFNGQPFTGDFLKIKADIDSLQDSNAWIATTTFPLYWGPLDDLYKDDPMFSGNTSSPSPNSSPETFSPYMDDLQLNVENILLTEFDKFVII